MSEMNRSNDESVFDQAQGSQELTGNQELTGSQELTDSQESAGNREHTGFTVKDRRFWSVSAEELEDKESRAELPSYVERLKNELEEKDKQLKEYIAAYKKEVVEGLEKTKERLERDSAIKQEQLRGQIAGPMIEVLDALELSLSAGESNADRQVLLQGVKMVHQLMLQKLQELGLTRVATMGQPFDPAFCEAIGVVPVLEAAQNNIIMGEIKPGFMLGDRVVRPALVQVGKYSA